MTSHQAQHAAPAQPGESQRIKVVLTSLLTLGAVSYVDYATGYEFRFFIFYFIPVGLCGWHLGRLAALGMALLCGVIWFLLDVLTAHYYPHEAIRYWNGFTFFLAFTILGLVLHHLRQSRDKELEARRELERLVAELQESTQEIRKLQSGLQVVCAWTNRIKFEGKWVALDEFLTNTLNVKVSHGISPEAFEEIRKQLTKE